MTTLGEVDSEATKRFFTVREANAALPLVQRVVQDIVAAHGKVTRIHEECQQAKPSDPARRSLEADREAAAERLNELICELSEIGCQLKDWEAGLVDFPAVTDGREVCLCWKLGEDQVGYWHEPDAGYGGRQEITEEM